MDIINKILDQKWLITVILMFLLGFMVITGKVTSEVFIPIITTLIGYYFGSSTKVNNNNKTE